MAFQFASRNRRKARRYSLQKPRGVIHPRVQAVGPEHFGFLCVDCAKARSKIMLADFYGRVLIQPTTVTHDRFGLDAFQQSVRDVAARHVLKDLIVVLERTGSYHRVMQRALTKAGFEVRIIHPFVTKQYRQPADPGKREFASTPRPSSGSWRGLDRRLPPKTQHRSIAASSSISTRTESPRCAACSSSNVSSPRS